MDNEFEFCVVVLLYWGAAFAAVAGVCGLVRLGVWLHDRFGGER